ncbi:MAG TPA: type I methionyl aminopeptidase [Desulfurobacteriaceae bacterium]|nr:type I methionyl aminopeptidase [Desulfurobacteriaceae bacterium]
MENINIYTEDDIKKVKEAGKVVAIVLGEVVNSLKEGITTYELDKIAKETCEKLGAKCAFYGYRGFPGNICVSINNEIIHGIPSKTRKIKEGDIVKLDFGAYLNGYYGDAAVTVGVGKISPLAKKLIDATRQSLYNAIKAAKVGNKLSDIGKAVYDYVSQFGFDVLREYAGHGIGKNLHEPPHVFNYPTSYGEKIKLQKGMILAIEPMVTAGKPKVRTKRDNWTVVTKDGKISAHFEHTIAILENEALILTPWEEYING